MEYDKDKVDDITLALLYLVSSTDQYGTRAWKSFSWDTMDRLYAKGFIGDPRGKSASVLMTPEGVERARALFSEYFATD